MHVVCAIYTERTLSTSDTVIGDQNKSLHSECSNRNGRILVSNLTQFNTMDKHNTHTYLPYTATKAITRYSTISWLYIQHYEKYASVFDAQSMLYLLQVIRTLTDFKKCRDILQVKKWLELTL